MKFGLKLVNYLKGFDNGPVYIEKYLKTKVKFYEEKISANFHNNKIKKEGSQCVCLSVVLINYVFGTVKNYYL